MITRHLKENREGEALHLLKERLEMDSGSLPITKEESQPFVELARELGDHNTVEALSARFNAESPAFQSLAELYKKLGARH